MSDETPVGCAGYHRPIDNRLAPLCIACYWRGRGETIMPSIRRDAQGVAQCSHRTTEPHQEDK